MRKIITEDQRYVIIVDENRLFNEYYVYETFDNYDIEPIMDKDASIFFHTCIKEDFRHQVGISVKSDGCANMNSMTDNVMTHFCNKSHIDSYYGMINICYEDARECFEFEDL